MGNDRVLKELEVPDLQVVKELNAGITLGQIVLSNSEHMMFAGTSEGGKPGCVRAYSFPLTGDYLEVHTHKQSPQMRFFFAYQCQMKITSDKSLAREKAARLRDSPR